LTSRELRLEFLFSITLINTSIDQQSLINTSIDQQSLINTSIDQQSLINTSIDQQMEVLSKRPKDERRGPVHLVLFIWSCSSGPVHLVLFIWSCSSGPVHLVRTDRGR